MEVCNSLAPAGDGDDQSSILPIKKPRLMEHQSQVDLFSPQFQVNLIDTLSDTKPLIPPHEYSKGITYSQPLPTGWKPRKTLSKHCDSIRKSLGILLDGEDIPPPVNNFVDMRFPNPILNKLTEKGILKPTPIQMQGLPVVLSGRDMIGISFTGSGKTMVFVIPMIMLAMQEELSMRIVPSEGLFGLVICPTRELAEQTYRLVEEFLVCLKENGYPEVRSLLCIGGNNDRKLQVEVVKKKGVHLVVATPGRLKDMLARKEMNLDNCKYVTLDEADRLIDDDSFDVRAVFDRFKSQRQTLLFSATMPTKILNFAKTSLVKPVIVNVGRAGAANMNVKQCVEYVKQEDKNLRLLRCLEKTAPPVLVFSENKGDVDHIHEYLLVKGVDAVAIHGGKDQEDRQNAISSFKNGKKSVLVATDIASKGLDFPDIQHVINYDMPAEIENYVHRIGRTGRSGKKGRATTFINKNQREPTLLDLKQLLREAKQIVPPMLAELNHPIQDANTKGCANCGGPGHCIDECPKLKIQNKMAIARLRGDYFGSGGYRGEI